MQHKFKIWSESNPEVVDRISPALDFRDWDNLVDNEKEIILKQFRSNGWFQKEANYHVLRTILNLNDKYKRESYGRRTLEHQGPHYVRYPDLIRDCCTDEAINDFNNIFLREKQDVVYEMLSIYAGLLVEYTYLRWLDRKETEKEKLQSIEYAYEKFDGFMVLFNDIAEQFSINIALTRNGFVFRQDEKITKEIYEPVIKILSDPKWAPVNMDLADAFKDYQGKDFSSSVTHAVSALQAFLQLTVYDTTGRGEISSLIVEARKNEKIPANKFTEQIFKNIESVLMYERQQTGDPHPKKEYATEKNARLVLNLVMVFLQHCLQK